MGNSSTGSVSSTGTVQTPQVVGTKYAVSADYVGIAVVFFLLGYLLALKTSTAVASKIQIVYGHK